MSEDNEVLVTEYLILREAGSFYAIDIKNIETIIHSNNLRSFPNLPTYILGTTVFKENLIPIFDLSNLLNLSEKQIVNNGDFYIVVIKSKNEYVGINVEQIFEIIEHKKKPRKDALLTKNKKHLFLGSIKLRDLHYLNSDKELVNVIDIQNIYSLIEKEFFKIEQQS